jgi:hypothetical protein
MAETAPVVEVDMLDSAAGSGVYEAFTDPERITKFWLAQSCGSSTASPVT